MMFCDAKKTILIIFLLLFSYFQVSPAQEYLLVYNQERFFPENFQDLKQQIAQAESLVAENKQKEAIAVYEKIVKENPSHLNSWQRLAQLYSWNEMQDSAIVAYEKIVQLNPVDLEAKKTLAQFYLWTGKQLKAIDLYEKVLSFEPRNLEIHKKLAQLYSWNNMPQKAIAEYEQIVQLDSSDTSTMKMLADHYFWTNRPEDGIRMLEKIVQLEPDSLQYRKKLAQQLIWNNRPQEAIEQYEQILEKEPENAEILKELARQYLWNNEPAKAATLYERLVTLEPDSLAHKIKLARTYIWSNQSKKAEKPLLEILQKQPMNKEALIELAEIERWSGKWDLAKERIRKVLLLDPANERMLKLLKDIRQNYGTFVLSKYTRLSDSNLITRESFPIAAGCFHNRFWDFHYQAAQYRVIDDKIDSTLIGYGASVAANFHPFSGTTVTLQIGAINFNSNWTPLSAKLQFMQNWRGNLTAKLSLERHETQEGVRALTEKIIMQGWNAEIYWQVLSKWAIAGNYQLFNYSDDNQKLTATAATYFTVRQEKPNLYLYAYYLFEDFDRIYLNSLPYWTPEKLKTTSLGFNFKHKFFPFLTVEGGYGLTRQQGINSNNFIGGVTISFTDFDKLKVYYQKTGSQIYHSNYFITSFEHRF